MQFSICWRSTFAQHLYSICTVAIPTNRDTQISTLAGQTICSTISLRCRKGLKMGNQCQSQKFSTYDFYSPMNALLWSCPLPWPWIYVNAEKTPRTKQTIRTIRATAEPFTKNKITINTTITDPLGLRYADFVLLFYFIFLIL